MTYNADGKRVRKTAGGDDKKYLYDYNRLLPRRQPVYRAGVDIDRNFYFSVLHRLSEEPPHRRPPDSTRPAWGDAGRRSA